RQPKAKQSSQECTTPKTDEPPCSKARSEQRAHRRTYHAHQAKTERSARNLPGVAPWRGCRAATEETSQPRPAPPSRSRPYANRALPAASRQALQALLTRLALHTKGWCRDRRRCEGNLPEAMT